MLQSECRDVTQTEKWSLNTPSPLCSEASTTYCADAASNLQLVLSNERTALVLPSHRAARQNRERERDRKRKRESAYFRGKHILSFFIHIYISDLIAVAIILYFPFRFCHLLRRHGNLTIVCLTLTRVCLSRLKESRDVYHPTPPRPAHSHLLVLLPFAAVKIKLHIMVAITSLASWLLLTPNQLFCFLAMFIAIAWQIVCFETAKSNSPMCKKEHLIGSQCSLCWFELRANEGRWVGERACVRVQM